MKEQLTTIENVSLNVSIKKAEKKKRRQAASNGVATHVPPPVLKGDEHTEAPDAETSTHRRNSRGVARKKTKPGENISDPDLADPDPPPSIAA